MPNRIIREGILTSERVARLSWEEEIFYRRLMSIVDDFGRYYANPKLLRAACYPLQLDRVSDENIERWLQAVQEAGLVIVYSASDGKRYLEMLDFRQQTRAKASKYPSAKDASAAGDAHMHSTCIANATQTSSKRAADAHVYVYGDGDGYGGESPRARVKPQLVEARKPSDQRRCGCDAHKKIEIVEQSENLSANTNKAPPESSCGEIPPISLPQAKEAAKMAGIPPEVAEIWWLEMDGRGWVDGRGQLVRNWRSAMTCYGRKWQANAATKEKQHGHAKSSGRSYDRNANTYNKASDYDGVG